MYVAGWDGGGTKTKLCLTGMQGEEIYTGFAGPLNPNGTDEATVRQSIRDAISQMEPLGLSECAALVIGMAGISNAHAAQFIENTVREAGYTGRLALKGDQEISLAGAILGHGATLIAGTGSVLFGRDKSGEAFRVGGYGYLIDDPGSGYAIGRDILRAVVRASDGREGATVLSGRVMDTLGITEIPELITWLYDAHTGKREVAALSRLLPSVVEAGDEAARSIMEQAAKDLTDMVIAGWRRAGMTDGELAYAGSVLEKFDALSTLVSARIHASLPEVTIGFPRSDPAHGAAKLALELTGA
ncbi:MAG: ATPase [Clostridia bacterium]|nr:ATPase [Clostridia bacterium]